MDIFRKFRLSYLFLLFVIKIFLRKRLNRKIYIATSDENKVKLFLILNFRRVLIVVSFLLCSTTALEDGTDREFRNVGIH